MFCALARGDCERGVVSGGQCHFWDREREVCLVREGFKALVAQSQNPPTKEVEFPPISTQEAIEEFLEAKRAAGLSEMTIKSYAVKLRFFARHYPILPATPEDIEHFLSAYRGDTPTGRDYHAAITTLYNFICGRRGLPNPARKVAKPRFKTKTPDRLTATQAKALLDAIEADRERALVYCFLGLGLRREEVHRMRFGDIRGDTVMVKGKERTESLHLIAEIRDALLKVAGGRGADEPLFEGRGGALCGDMLRYIIRKLFTRAGIEGVKPSPHTLRHTRGVLTAAGLDSLSSKRLLRHRTTAMTDLYSQLNTDELIAKEERFNPLRILGDSNQRRRLHEADVASSKILGMA